MHNAYYPLQVCGTSVKRLNNRLSLLPCNYYRGMRTVILIAAFPALVDDLLYLGVNV